jgi:hypothetical protein
MTVLDSTVAANHMCTLVQQTEAYLLLCLVQPHVGKTILKNTIYYSFSTRGGKKPEEGELKGINFILR